jgi:hypothetical protein
VRADVDFDRRNSEMSYYGLGCRCGGAQFLLAGWPRSVTGEGGFFWRTVARVWREARAPMQDGEPVESPFWLPVGLICEACGREAMFLDGGDVAGRMPVDQRNAPRESYRCRVCRGGSVEIVVGEARDACTEARADHEIIAHCCACHRQARIAWSEGRPSAQEVRLDVLYGRR